MLTVSIVTYKTPPEELRQCLRSLASKYVDRIYVVDNSSLPELGDICAEDDRVVYMPNMNTGYGSGHNMAIRSAMEQVAMPYHLVLNSDVEFEPKVIDRLVEFLEANKDVGIVQPRVTYPNGAPQYTCRLLPTPANVFFRRFFPPLGKVLDKRYLIKDYDHKEPLQVPSLQGSFMMMRVEALQKCGLFDERYFMYSEDIDLTRRIYREYRTMYYPAVKISHVHRAASYRSLRMMCIHIANMIRYFNKWGWFSDPERKAINEETLERVAQLNAQKR